MSKILIVEDEVAIADLEKDYLELSGFDVEVANDGLVGYQKAMEEDYNLVILDLMLPGMDGFEICRKLREEKNTPIIMWDMVPYMSREKIISMMVKKKFVIADEITQPFFEAANLISQNGKE